MAILPSLQTYPVLYAGDNWRCIARHCQSQFKIKKRDSMKFALVTPQKQISGYCSSRRMGSAEGETH
ncbi:MAG: hypothetical protein LBG66_02995, partial [Gallionellaceae bacterium]|nr:hypothetical protein [Gallionellaceae bacterium]